jgi:cytochrome c oxidase subunit IV
VNTNYLYLIIFAILIGETDIEVNLISLVQQNIIAFSTYASILLGLAATKAIMIAMFYQHLKYEPKSLSAWVILGIVIASILMSFSFLQLSVHSFQYHS